MPYGGRIRQAGRLQPLALGSGTVTITMPDGPCPIMPLPTCDLEAAFQVTGAADINAACGADFVLTIPGTSPTDTIPAHALIDADLFLIVYGAPTKIRQALSRRRKVTSG